jgi:hypothetical protein
MSVFRTGGDFVFDRREPGLVRRPPKYPKTLQVIDHKVVSSYYTEGVSDQEIVDYYLKAQRRWYEQTSTGKSL